MIDVKDAGLVLIAVAALGCGGRGNQPNGAPEVPEECALPDGVEVTALALDESEGGTLPATGERQFSVSVTITRTAAAAEAFVPVCFVVRDRDAVASLPVAAGFVGLLAGETEVRRETMFRLFCNGANEVEGRGMPVRGADALDRSSGERSTRVFVQHAEDVRLIGDQVVGLRGTKSPAIQVECPRR